MLLVDQLRKHNFWFWCARNVDMWKLSLLAGHTLLWFFHVAPTGQQLARSPPLHPPVTPPSLPITPGVTSRGWQEGWRGGVTGRVTTAMCNKCERSSKTMTYIIIIRCSHLAKTHVGVFVQRIKFVEIQEQKQKCYLWTSCETQLLILVCAKCRYVKIKFVGLPHDARKQRMA